MKKGKVNRCGFCEMEAEEKERRACPICGYYVCKKCMWEHIHMEWVWGIRRVEWEEDGQVRCIRNLGGREKKCDECGQEIRELRTCDDCGELACWKCYEEKHAECNWKEKNKRRRMGKEKGKEKRYYEVETGWGRCRWCWKSKREIRIEGQGWRRGCVTCEHLRQRRAEEWSEWEGREIREEGWIGRAGAVGGLEEEEKEQRQEIKEEGRKEGGKKDKREVKVKGYKSKKLSQWIGPCCTCKDKAGMICGGHDDPKRRCACNVCDECEIWYNTEEGEEMRGCQCCKNKKGKGEGQKRREARRRRRRAERKREEREIRNMEKEDDRGKEREGRREGSSSSWQREEREMGKKEEEEEEEEGEESEEGEEKVRSDTTECEWQERAGMEWEEGDEEERKERNKREKGWEMGGGCARRGCRREEEKGVLPAIPDGPVYCCKACMMDEGHTNSCERRTERGEKKLGGGASSSRGEQTNRNKRRKEREAEEEKKREEGKINEAKNEDWWCEKCGEVKEVRRWLEMAERGTGKGGREGARYFIVTGRKCPECEHREDKWILYVDGPYEKQDNTREERKRCACLKRCRKEVLGDKTHCEECQVREGQECKCEVGCCGKTEEGNKKVNEVRRGRGGEEERIKLIKIRGKEKKKGLGDMRCELCGKGEETVREGVRKGEGEQERTYEEEEEREECGVCERKKGGERDKACPVCKIIMCRRCMAKQMIMTDMSESWWRSWEGRRRVVCRLEFQGRMKECGKCKTKSEELKTCGKCA